MKRISARVAILLGVLSLTVAACGGTSKTSSTPQLTPAPAETVAPTTSAAQQATSSTVAPTKTILELAKLEGSLSTLLKLLDVAGLTATLQGTGPFSLIAPSDAAFAKMDPATLDKFTKNPDALKSLLQYHLVGSRISTKNITAGFVKSLEGSNLVLHKSTGPLPTVNGLAVTKAARGTNGIILVVESVLLPVDLKLP